MKRGDNIEPEHVTNSNKFKAKSKRGETEPLETDGGFTERWLRQGPEPALLAIGDRR